MNKFMSYSRVLPWFMALLLSALAAGCGGGDGGRAPILGADGIAGIAPTVTATSPLARTPIVTGVSINSKVTATFSKAMDSATINTSTFTVACPAGTAITGTVAYVAASRIATFSHTTNFPINTTCTATITTGAKDSTGLALASNFVWSFKTGSSVDATRPTVTETVPATTNPGPTPSVAPNTQITATFSEDMDPATISGTSFTVVNTTLGGTAVAGAVSYGVGKIATFTPTTTLPISTLFTATVTTVAADLAGNTLLANYVWTFETSAILDTTPPTVTLVNPLDLAPGVCINKTVNATFSEAMDATTITTATFTLAPTATLGSLVTGVVTYDAPSKIASFNPTANLTASTQYTATIKGGASGVKDLAGNALAVNKVWTFTTGTTECQAPVALGSASNFAILASAAVTNIPTSAITGDVGLTPDTGANITGFSSPATCPEVTGRIYAVNAAGPACALIDATLLSNAKTDALAAFTYANAVARGTATNISTNLAGLTLYPGLYESLTTLDFSAGGKLYLDAQGDVNAVFILRSSNAITTLSTSEVVLTGGAKATNVFWTAGSAVTLGTNSIMKGSMIAGTALTLQTGATLEGRALNQGAAAAAIGCDKCTITVPLP